MPEKLTDSEIAVITDALIIVEELRNRTQYLDPQTFSLLLELRDALEMFDL